MIDLSYYTMTKLY